MNKKNNSDVLVKDLTIEQHNEILNVIINTNSVQFNSNKALEELGEFQEVLIKYQTKSPDNAKRPTQENIIGEFGDLIIRGMCAVCSVTNISMDDLEEKLGNHIDKKMAKLYNYYKLGKYKNEL